MIIDVESIELLWECDLKVKYHYFIIIIRITHIHLEKTILAGAFCSYLISVYTYSTEGQGEIRESQKQEIGSGIIK